MKKVTETASLGVSVVAAALLLSGCAQEPADPAAKALQLVERWVYGNYNNLAQAEADAAANLLAEQMHRPMHQLFARVEVPNLDGYILYQQSSFDGSENPGMIFRHGLMQYFPDDESATLRQRELYFIDSEQYKNAHRNPEILQDLTLDDLTWDEGCDFYLEANADATLVSGPIIEKACVQFNQGLQKNMYADDVVEITANEYRFRGRFIDDEGNVLWGTESEVLNTMVRQD